MDSPGFAAWKKRRAERAETATAADELYRDFVSTMTGEAAELRAGVASTGTPGGREVPDDLDEEQVYQAYRDVLSGEAGRRQAEATARREKIEREDEIVRHARIAGGGLSSSHEHLRSRLEGFGRPHEGGRV